MTFSATERIPAPRAEVWAVLAEPLHLPDWWPGLLAVEPDRRGFAPGRALGGHRDEPQPFLGSRRVETTLLLRDIDLYERWTWHLVNRRLDVEIRLRAAASTRPRSR